jgi:hypothetical protein
VGPYNSCLNAAFLSEEDQRLYHPVLFRFHHVKRLLEILEFECVSGYKPLQNLMQLNEMLDQTEANPESRNRGGNKPFVFNRPTIPQEMELGIDGLGFMVSMPYRGFCNGL